MKKIFYRIIWIVCRIELNLYFKSIEVNGRNKLPKDGAIIYAPNHQNAFLDAIIIAILSPEPVSFFTRADIFKPPFLWFLDALNMLPVLRAKDGFSKVLENDATFNTSIRLLIDRKPLMIFPEASHAYPHYLRTLSKGTARIAFTAQEKCDHPIYIVPVGLNFFRQHRPRYKLIVNYGNAINVKDQANYYKEHKGKALTSMRNQMTKVLKSQMVIPDFDEHYERRTEVFSRSNEQIPFHDLKSKAMSMDIEKDPAFPALSGLIGILSLINYPLIAITQYVLKRIGDPVFGGSIKFAAGLFLGPIWYGLSFFVLNILCNFWIAGLITLAMVICLFLRQELIRFVE